MILATADSVGPHVRSSAIGGAGRPSRDRRSSGASSPRRPPSPDGRWIVTGNTRRVPLPMAGGDMRGGVRLRVVGRGDLRVGDGGLRAVADIAYEPGGRLVAVAKGLEGVGLLSGSGRMRAKLLDDGETETTAVAFAPVGDRLATASADGHARIWDVSGCASASATCRAADPDAAVRRDQRAVQPGRRAGDHGMRRSHGAGVAMAGRGRRAPDAQRPHQRGAGGDVRRRRRPCGDRGDGPHDARVGRENGRASSACSSSTPTASSRSPSRRTARATSSPAATTAPCGYSSARRAIRWRSCRSARRRWRTGSTRRPKRFP